MEKSADLQGKKSKSSDRIVLFVGEPRVRKLEFYSLYALRRVSNGLKPIERCDFHRRWGQMQGENEAGARKLVHASWVA